MLSITMLHRIYPSIFVYSMELVTYFGLKLEVQGKPSHVFMALSYKV